MGWKQIVGIVDEGLGALARLRPPIRRRSAVLAATATALMVGAAALSPRAPAPAEPLAAAAPGDEPEFEARSNVVFDAWLDHVRDREIAEAAGTFARRFRITPTLAARIYAAAHAEEIRPEVAFGLIRAESSFRTSIVSPAGAVGLTQVLPSTGRWIMPGTTRRDLMDPDTNLRVGFRYLRYLYDKYDGNERLALTAYNRGPGTVDRHLRQGRDPDNGYVEMVLTGQSKRHTALMNQRFGRSRS
jgi:soluble lytic murein transglycosylase-like protein